MASTTNNGTFTVAATDGYLGREVRFFEGMTRQDAWLMVRNVLNDCSVAVFKTGCSDSVWSNNASMARTLEICYHGTLSASAPATCGPNGCEDCDGEGCLPYDGEEEIEAHYSRTLPGGY